MSGLGQGRKEQFTRQDRLHRRREFDAVYSGGMRIPERHFVLFILPNTIGRARLGLTLGRAVGNAVVRNRSRRRLREVFRRRRDVLGVSLDIVVQARPGIGKAAQADLEAELLSGVARFLKARGAGR